MSQPNSCLPVLFRCPHVAMLLRRSRPALPLKLLRHAISADASFNGGASFAQRLSPEAEAFGEGSRQSSGDRRRPQHAGIPIYRDSMLFMNTMNYPSNGYTFFPSEDRSLLPDRPFSGIVMLSA